MRVRVRGRVGVRVGVRAEYEEYAVTSYPY